MSQQVEEALLSWQADTPPAVCYVVGVRSGVKAETLRCASLVKVNVCIFSKSRINNAILTMPELVSVMGGGTGGTRDRSPAMFSTFNIMPIGVAWKESTSNGPRPPHPPIVAA